MKQLQLSELNVKLQQNSRSYHNCYSKKVDTIFSGMVHMWQIYNLLTYFQYRYDNKNDTE